MKGKSRAKPDICKELRFEAVNGMQRFQFLIFEYRFFSDSNKNDALPLRLRWPLSPLSLMLHIVKSRALVLFRLPCFFAKIENKIVGLWAIEDYHASLIVASLAVAKEYRRLGIATCILDYIEAMAIRMGKKWLEVAVLRKNVPAQHLYRKFGFVFTESRRTHFIMRGKKPL